ncbi:mitochondrial protein 99 [Novymonas esmeraldas]|uniref:Mitochondrial protein 99 n=1 Tax=Novymonas esmeraldas TaxID=1808958 RepID=A0AAW0F1F1_9TRYP
MFAVSRGLSFIAGVSGGGGSSSSSSTHYRNSADIADSFHAGLNRTQGGAFDHVVIDVSHFASTLGYLTRDLMGHERDSETVKNIQRQLQAIILRRIQPRKSLALLMDGSEPLWTMEHRRLFPGRRFDSRVYRSCASPMPHLLEERLRAVAVEQRPAPAEALLSGPSTPGLAEGKISSYLLDLAARLVYPPTTTTTATPPQPSPPAAAAAAVTPADTVCLVGGPELAWLAIGATPLLHVTATTLQHGELKSCSLSDAMAWLRLGHLLPAAATEQQQQQQRQRLAAIRTDLVLLYLLTQGHGNTGLPQVLTTPFADVVDAYVALETEAHESGGLYTSPGAPQRLRSILFDEYPITAATIGQPSLRLRVAGLQQLLVRVMRSTVGAHVGVPSGSRPTPHAATLLTMALQVHGLLCSGGIPSPAWTPTPDPAVATANTSAALNGTALLDKFPKMGVEMLLQHLSYMLANPGKHSSTATAAAGAAGGAAAGGVGETTVYMHPPRSLDFALTGAEALVLTATQAEQIHHVLPLYVRGHALPDGAAEDIVQTRNIHEALRKTRRLLAGALDSARAEAAAAAAQESDGAAAGAAAGGDAGGPHPALTHLPTHLFRRRVGALGPPQGWMYHGVHLGLRAEALNARYSINASDAAPPRVIDSADG